MKIAAHFLAYNINQFIGPVLENLKDHVDKIFIAYPTRPWGYNETSRETNTNPTSLDLIESFTKGIDCPVEILSGDWNTEEEMRNACLYKAREQGFDWFIIQDADEFYTDEVWDQIRDILSKDRYHDHFVTTWYNFWKTPQFVLENVYGDIKGINAGFAVRCKSDVQFVRKRICDSKKSMIIDCPCYHYGYVMADSQMKEKLSTWGHANEIFSNNWYALKWENWSLSTKYLHPVAPIYWKRAVRFPLEQPAFAHQFNGLEFSKPKLTLKHNFLDRFYDIKVSMVFMYRNLRKSLKAN